MPLFKRKQEKQKAASAVGKDSASVKRTPSSRSNPQSPDSTNGDIGVPSSMLDPTGASCRPTLVLSEESLNSFQEDADLGGPSPKSPMKASSRLSKTLQEVLHDKDALHCFLQFMESRQAERYIRFWLDANSFRVSTLTRMRTHSLQSVGSSLLLKRRSEERGGEGESQGEESVKSVSDNLKAERVTGGEREVEVGGRDCDRSISEQTVDGGCGGGGSPSKAQPSNLTADSKESQRPCEGGGGVLTEGKPSSLRLSPVSVSVTPACVSADQLENAESSSTDQSVHSLQDSGIATPSEGDLVISPSSQSESLGDTESVDTLTDEDIHTAASADACRTKSSGADSGSQTTKDQNFTKTAEGVLGSVDDSCQAETVITDSQEAEVVRNEPATKPNRSLSVEEMREKLKKSIERDAVSIFSKYIAQDAPQPIGVGDALRGETIHKICREDKQVDPECFVACQDFVVAHMEKEYHKPFMDSEFNCKHQVNVLTQTGGQVYLADILYNEHALCYFMEFMEQEGAQHLMQFWMAADNFQQQLTQQEGAYDGMQAQNDAMILYDRFFSLQATTPLGFDDKIRFEVEGNICREQGPLPDCFSKPRDIVLHTLDKIFFGRYMSSEIYYRYLSDLISTVQMAQDLPVRKHRRQASDASSEHSVGSQSVGAESISSRNTLLAAASRSSRKASSPSSASLSGMVGRIEEHLSTMDTDFLNPEDLWKQPNKSSLRLGTVNCLGQFVSEFDPDPDNSKKKGGGFFKKNKTKEKEQEQMAMQVAQMILNDVANMTQMGDACARTDDDDNPPATTNTNSSNNSNLSIRPNTLSSSQSLSTAFSSVSFFEPPPS